jgi:glucokinase
VSSDQVTIGVDIGGTKILGAVVTADGEIVRRERVPTPGRGSSVAQTTEAISRLLEDLTGSHQAEAVGVAAAGFVDEGRSMVRYAPNLSLEDAPLRAELEKELDLPVVLENDANAAAWAEFRFGAARDADHLLMVTVGTGVGGGIVIDGELLRGRYGSAAEVGHLRVVPEGLPCPCGQRGCWEQYASGSALVRMARERAADEAAAHLLETVGGEAAAITGPSISSAAESGDPFATSLLTELGRWLGEGVATLAAVLDPEVVVVGGGVSEAGDLLLGPLREAFSSHLTAKGHRPEAAVVPASLGNQAGVIGAADLARRS